MAIINKTHTGRVVAKNVDIPLAFLNSLDINVFPCSRRNSSIIATQKEGQSHYFFPYDPEARLTTEANKMRESSANGFTRSYIKSVNLEKAIQYIHHTQKQDNPADKTEPTAQEKVTGKNDVNFSTLPGFNFVVGGYNFNIPLNTPASTFSLTELGNIIQTELKDLTHKNIYANIRLVEVPLYAMGDSGTLITDQDGNKPDSKRTIVANTWVLRDQMSSDTTASDAPEAHLDAFASSATLSGTPTNVRDVENYFFSGLSFSVEPLTGIDDTTTYSEAYITNESIGVYDQRVVSLRILEKKGSEWVINQKALLPNIWHGEEEDSVEVKHFRTRGHLEIDGDLHVKGNLMANTPNKIAQFYNVDIDHNIDVDGNGRVDGDFYVGGNTELAKDLSVGGNTHIAGSTHIDNNITIDNNLQTKQIKTEDLYATGFISRQHKNKVMMGLVTTEVVTGAEGTDEYVGTDANNNKIIFNNKDCLDTALTEKSFKNLKTDYKLGFRHARNNKRLILHTKNNKAVEIVENNKEIPVVTVDESSLQLRGFEKFSMELGAHELLNE